MTYIGIDPALRDKGLAVCFMVDKVISFKVYKKFIDFILDVGKWKNNYKNIKVMIEDSSKQNVTFNRGTNYRSALAISRNVGMNQAASIIITQLCKYYGYNTTLISPKNKGSKWTIKLFNLVVNENQFLVDKNNISQDEIDAFTLTYILKLNDNEKTKTRNP